MSSKSIPHVSRSLPARVIPSRSGGGRDACVALGLRLELSPDGDRIVRSVPIERGHPRYREPTLGALVGRELYYVANSQWELFGEDGRIAEPDSLQQPVVLRLRL